MVSMTGYGRGETAATLGKWSVEIASVNRKQLEVVVQLPKEFNQLESRVRECLSQSVSRGRVVVSIAFSQQSGTQRPGIPLETAQAVKRELIDLCEALSLPKEITLDHILRHPAIFVKESLSESADELWQSLLPALELAITDFKKMRQTEGEALSNDLKNHLKELSRLIAEIRALAPEVPARQRSLLVSRLAELDGVRMPDESRLATELALFAERCDVSEELARLESHLQQFEEKLTQEAPVGRALEFLVQEMFREIHTTGSKASHTEIAKLVVESKSVLDKIREQLANIE